MVPLRPRPSVEGSLDCPQRLLFGGRPSDSRARWGATPMPWAVSGRDAPCPWGSRTSPNRPGRAREGARRPLLTPYASLFLQRSRQPGLGRGSHQVLHPAPLAALRGTGLTGPPQQALSSTAPARLWVKAAASHPCACRRSQAASPPMSLRPQEAGGLAAGLGPLGPSPGPYTPACDFACSPGEDTGTSCPASKVFPSRPRTLPSSGSWSPWSPCPRGSGSFRGLSAPRTGPPWPSTA